MRALTVIILVLATIWCAGNIILGAAAHSMTALLAQKTLSAANAPIAGERDFVLLVGADGLWLVDTSVAGWALR